MIPDAEFQVHMVDTLWNRSTHLKSLVDVVSVHSSKKKKKALNHDQEKEAV